MLELAPPKKRWPRRWTEWGEKENPKRINHLGFLTGGGGGIRTLGSVATTPDFESGTFDHSATPPGFCRRLNSSRAHQGSLGALSAALHGAMITKHCSAASQFGAHPSCQNMDRMRLKKSCSCSIRISNAQQRQATHVRAQHVGHGDRTICVLVIFQYGHQRTAHG